MNDTPRTDAALLRGIGSSLIMDLMPYGTVVRSDFARTLERELNEANAKLADWLKMADEHRKRKVASDSPVAACDCLVKSPEIQYHEPGCRYRLICERDALREATRVKDEALRALREWMQQDSVAGTGDYDQGLMCGVEDRGYQTDGYAAMRYGYDRALERVSEYIDPLIAALSQPVTTEAREEKEQRLTFAEKCFIAGCESAGPTVSYDYALSRWQTSYIKTDIETGAI